MTGSTHLRRPDPGPDPGRLRRTPRPRPGRPARLRTVLIAGATGLAAIAAPLLASSPAAANAPDTSVTVNLAQTGGAPTHAGSGFLYGLTQDGSGPADSLLQPLQPTLFRGGGARLAGDGWIGDGYTDGSGYQARIASAIDQARRVTSAPYGSTYDLLVSDLYGADTTQPSNTVYPCDNGNCSNWTTFIDQVVHDVQASGVNVAYDIWNEPDGTGFWQRGVNSAQYFQMWDTAVRDIRTLVPSAVIVGPSFSGYNHSFLSGFLTQVKADGTLPNVLNWHFGDDPVADSTDAAGIVSSLSLAPLPQSVNEYLFSNQQDAGDTAWWLDRFAQSGITQAAHAIWTDCCMAGTLDSVLAGSGSGEAPTGQWWVYRAYAALSGKTVATSSGNADIAVAASENQSTDQAVALLGNDSGQTGTTTIDVTGLSSTPWLTAGSTVHATLLRIPDQSPLSAPITVSDSDVAISNGSIGVPVTYQAANDAYFLELSPHGLPSLGGSGPTVNIIDGNVTGSGTDEFDYGANWGLTTGVSDMYDGTANWSYVAGATATFTFNGSQVALHAVKDVDQGIMSISVDGGAAQNVDDYAPSRNASGIVWTSPILAPGTHTLTIVNTGQRNAASSGNNIAIDRADVYVAQTVDGNVTGTGTDEFNYSSGWGLTTGVSDMYAGTANWSQTAGSTASFTFTGNEAALHAVRDVDQAIMTVSVDGGAATTVDNYAPSRNASAIVWTSGNLATGTHTVKITVTGARNPASSGPNIALDCIDIIDT